MFIFVVNVYLCHELFFLHYSKFLGSIEAAFISISRYVIQNSRDLTWFPLWYGGIPYQNTYPPLLHWIVAGAAQLTRTCPAHAHHLVTAFFYCLAPVSIYALVLRLSRSQTASFGAGLFYSLIAPSAFLAGSVLGDLRTPLGPRRLQALVVYGEGPHITALALIPLALLCLDVAVARRKPAYSVLAAFSMAAVALTNWLGAFALALAVASYLLANHQRLRTWLTTSGIGVLAYLLACPWIPPSTIRAIQFNAQTIGGDYTKIYSRLPSRLAILAICLLGLKYLFHRFKTAHQIQFAVFYAVLTGTITLAAEWFKFYLVPQPERYHLDMDQGIVLAVFCAVGTIVIAIPRWFQAVAILILVFAADSQVHRIRRFARDWIQPIDMTATSEYRIAKWFDANMNGARVMAAGSTSYWMNAFTDTPQLGGGFDQGVVNRQARIAHYIILSGENAGERDAEISILWMRAFGIQAVAVGGSPYSNPGKFDGILPLVWQEREARIYHVPQRSASLAHVVRREDLVSRAPIHGLDVGGIRKYVAALEDPTLPAPDFRWTSRHTAEITANLHAGQLLSVQESYHPGWRATVNGSRRRVTFDSLGLMVIEPDCDGPCVVELMYDGGVEMRIAHWLSLLALLGSGTIAVVSRPHS
ncbi:MAG: hypothetical protein M3Z85_22330 [Acidobacteriota bacterium]|nr:hypothetical protein [Acidobacteriota bacterium]